MSRHYRQGSGQQRWRDGQCFVLAVVVAGLGQVPAAALGAQPGQSRCTRYDGLIICDPPQPVRNDRKLPNGKPCCMVNSSADRRDAGGDGACPQGADRDAPGGEGRRCA